MTDLFDPFEANGLRLRNRIALSPLTRTRADMVAFGRAFIGNPDLVERLRLDAPLIDAPRQSYYGGGARGYTDFPTLAGAG